MYVEEAEEWWDSPAAVKSLLVWVLVLGVWFLVFGVCGIVLSMFGEVVQGSGCRF